MQGEGLSARMNVHAIIGPCEALQAEAKTNFMREYVSKEKVGGISIPGRFSGR